jgi:hypothetical protein
MDFHFVKILYMKQKREIQELSIVLDLHTIQEEGNQIMPNH